MPLLQNPVRIESCPDTLDTHTTVVDQGCRGRPWLPQARYPVLMVTLGDGPVQESVQESRRGCAPKLAPAGRLSLQ